MSDKIEVTEPNTTIRFIFVFVTELVAEDLDQLRRHIKDHFAGTPLPVEWRYYNFDELKQKFGVDEEQA